jgi:hypothetical protein
MYPKTNPVADGASTRVFHPSAMVSSLVICPMLPPDGVNMLEASQDVYRLAYEWAQAKLGPSPYELACRFVSN